MEIRKALVQRIKQNRLVAIIRLEDQQDVQNTIECLVAGGVTVLEVTSNTPGFDQEISKARIRYPEILIGAGTIYNSSLAKQAIACGAQFLVTPSVSKKVAKLAHKANIPVLMGALSPTEIVSAIEAEADIIKLFPAGELGLMYYRGVKGPFNKVDFFAVGGLGIDNIQPWFEEGVAGVGIGNELTKAVHGNQQKQQHIEYVKRFIAKLKQVSK
jgi:2-dehydro-3-deoxyphosphogluconate aldolase/(4S)-4-hydroxy-2-oxoglutarate aldolase